MSKGKQSKLYKFHVKNLDTQEIYYDYQELLTVGLKFRPALDLSDVDTSADAIWQIIASCFNSTAEKAKGKRRS